MLTIDIEKAFDSVDHAFLFAILDKLGFDTNFIEWIKVLHKNQESTVMNGGSSTGYFPLSRGSRQGDPISAYLFILVMEVFFTMVRTNPNIKGLNIFDFKYLLTSYADDTTFFIENQNSAVEIFNTFDKFSAFSGLKINKSKCEIAGIGTKNGALEVLPGVKNLNLNENSARILGVHFTYNTSLYNTRNFLDVVKKMENVLALWRWRNLSLLGKITVFKSLIFSKIIFITYLSNIPTSIIDKIETIKKDFIWNGKRPKVKHSALIGDYAEGGLKDIDIRAKVKSLHLCWIKRLYSLPFHPWKNIPLKIITNEFKQDIFYSNTSPKPPPSLPSFYKNILHSWSELAQDPITPDSILRQSIWFNQFILISNNPIKRLFNRPLFVADMFLPNGSPMPWLQAKIKLKLPNNYYFKWIQILSAIPNRWKNNLKENAPLNVTIIHTQHTLQVTRILPLNKLSSKQCYIILTHNLKAPPTSQQKISEILDSNNIDWPTVYPLGNRTTIDSYSRMFHFKCSHNILYLNKALFKMKITTTKICSLCKIADETIIHLFFECPVTKNLWQHIKQRYQNLAIPDLTPESAFFGFKHDLFLNQIHIIFRIAVYIKKDSNACSSDYIISRIEYIKKIEENLTFLDPKKKYLTN